MTNPIDSIDNPYPLEDMMEILANHPDFAHWHVIDSALQAQRESAIKMTDYVAEHMVDKITLLDYAKQSSSDDRLTQLIETLTSRLTDEDEALLNALIEPSEKLEARRAKRRRPDCYPFPDHR